MSLSIYATNDITQIFFIFGALLYTFTYLLALLTPCPEKRGHSNLGITVTNVAAVL